jgi:integrase
MALTRKRQIQVTYVNVAKITKHGETRYRARPFPPFDAELGIKPRPIDFIGKTPDEAAKKRDLYKPESKNLDKKTAFLDVVRDVYIPSVGARITSEAISYGYGSYSIDLLERYLLKPEGRAEITACKVRRVRLGLLTPAMMREYFEALKRECVPAEATHRIKQQIAGCLKGVKDGLAFRPIEFFEDVELPTIVTNTKRPMYDHEMVFAITRDEHLLIEDRALVAFLFMMHCRPSEMFALTWDDIDLKAGRVQFDKATRLVDKNKYEVTPGSKIKKRGQIRDDAGIRNVKVPADLLKLLRELKQWRKDTGKTSKWVFLTATGLPLQPGIRHRTRWASCAKRTGLPTGKGAPSFYALKHLGNSWALANGVTPEAQAEKMGQTTSRMATRVYRTILTPEKQKQADVFDVLVPRSAGSASH